jgi:hypothetical protein
MFTQIKALVGSVNDYGIFIKPCFFKVFKNLSNALINSSNAGKIILQIRWYLNLTSSLPESVL